MEAVGLGLRYLEIGYMIGGLVRIYAYLGLSELNMRRPVQWQGGEIHLTHTS